MADKKLLIKIGTKGGKAAKKSLNAIGGSLKKLTKITSVLGTGLAVVSTKLAGDFSKSLREVSTLMDNVAEKDIKKMSNELRQLSGTSGLALASLSKAKYDIVSAGFSKASDSANVLAVSTKLAVGGVTSAASAADLLTTALNAYGLESKESMKVADILFTTVKFGKTTMDELSQSLGQVLPIARSAGVSLESVGAGMATLTASGINTAESTTALRSAFLALTAPTDSAKAAMEQAGIEVKRFEDGTLDLHGTIKQFEGMSPDQIKKFIPNIRAVSAIQTMANNVDVLAKNLEGFEESTGAAETAFGKMAQEFNVKMARIKNNVQAGMIELGKAIIKKITPAIDKANGLFEQIGDIGWDVVGQTIAHNWKQIMGFLVNAIKAASDIVKLEMLAMMNGMISEMSSGMALFLGTSKSVAKESSEIYKQAAITQRQVLTDNLGTAFNFIIGKSKETKDANKELEDSQDAVNESIEEFNTLSEGGGEDGGEDGSEAEIEQLIISEEQKAAIRSEFNQRFHKMTQGSFKLQQEELEASVKRFKDAKIEEAKIETFVKEAKIALYTETAQAFASSTAGSLATMQKAGMIGGKEAKRMAQVQAMVDAYASANAAYKAMAGIPVVGPALGAVAGALALAAGLANVRMIESQQFAKGGLVSGQGGVDNVPAMLTAGEFVMTKQATSQIGIDNLQAMNQGASPITINIQGNVISDDDWIRDTLIPSIEHATTRNLA